MTVPAKIAALGENPTFIAANAHAWFAFAVVTVLAHWLPVPLVIVGCLLLVLGETTLVFGATPGLPPMDASVRDAYSIRHAIAAAAHAGTTANLGAML